MFDFNEVQFTFYSFVACALVSCLRNDGLIQVHKDLEVSSEFHDLSPLRCLISCELIFTSHRDPDSLCGMWRSDNSSII